MGRGTIIYVVIIYVIIYVVIIFVIIYRSAERGVARATAPGPRDYNPK